MTAPYQKHSETSKDAAEKVDVNYQERIILDYLKTRGVSGATGDEISQVFGIPIGTASARIVGLRNKKKIETTNIKRQTRSGRYGYVHVYEG